MRKAAPLWAKSGQYGSDPCRCMAHIVCCLGSIYIYQFSSVQFSFASSDGHSFGRSFVRSVVLGRSCCGGLDGPFSSFLSASDRACVCGGGGGFLSPPDTIRGSGQSRTCAERGVFPQRVKSKSAGSRVMKNHSGA